MGFNLGFKGLIIYVYQRYNKMRR